MQRILVTIVMMLAGIGSASAAVSLGLGIRGSGINIGIHVSSFPELVPVPGYPVYYDPRLESNYFFYDGLYWVFEGDNWYASSWYDGPWDLIDPYYVPVYVLRVPVRYYRRPPVYFRNWRDDAPPRWASHWGRDWQDRRRGWDQWDPRSVPRPAPLPTYQRDYSGRNYPRATEQQVAIRSDKYRYQPDDSRTREYWQQQDRRVRTEPESRARPEGAPRATPRREERSVEPQPGAERARTQRERAERAPVQQQDRAERERAAPNDNRRDDRTRERDSDAQGKAQPQDKGRGQQDRERGRDR